MYDTPRHSLEAYIRKGRRGGWGERRPFYERMVRGSGSAPYPSSGGSPISDTAEALTSVYPSGWGNVA